MGNHEEFNRPIDLSNKYPKDDMPISFTNDGKVLSRFSDDYWDLTSFIRGYETNAILDFSEKGTGLNKETLIHLRLITLYIILYEQRIKDIITLKTIRNKYRFFKVLAEFFKCSHSSFLNMKTNGIAQRKYLEKVSLNKAITIYGYLSSLVTLNKVGTFFELGEDFGIDESLMKKIQSLHSLAVSTTKQTILIPSRIYSEFIHKSLSAFQVLNENLANLETFFKEVFYTLPPRIGRQSVLFLEVVEKHGLLPYCIYFNINTSNDFFTKLAQMQNLGVFVVGCFSGMRKTEILNLGRDCLQRKEVDGKEVYLLNGYTSKTSKVGTKKTTWITSKTLVNVINTLQGLHSIVEIISNHHGVYQEVSIEEYPLFPSIPQRGKNRLIGIHPLYKYPPTLFNGSDLAIKLICKIEITQSDIDELIIFNPFIDWVEEYDLKIGKIWHFRSHQFRRSLVVYSIRSGIVQLAVLKKQLQHLTVDMTTYYGNSSGSASNLFDDDLINEFREENTRFQFVQYEEKVMDASGVLFGGEGTRLHLSKKMSQAPEYLVDKQKTLQYFQEGRLSYKKTPLGGCSKIGACDKLGFSYITVCIDCKDSIFGSSSKIALNKVKQAYIARLNKYDPDSITYKQLQIEINSIDRILNKVEVLEIHNV